MNPLLHLPPFLRRFLGKRIEPTKTRRSERRTTVARLRSSADDDDDGAAAAVSSPLLASGAPVAERRPRSVALGDETAAVLNAPRAPRI